MFQVKKNNDPLSVISKVFEISPTILTLQVSAIAVLFYTSHSQRVFQFQMTYNNLSIQTVYKYNTVTV